MPVIRFSAAPADTGVRARRPEAGRSGRVGAAVVAALLCGAVAAGCADAPAPAVSPEAVAAAELDRVTQTRNDADVVFVRAMLPHHEQGVELADLVTARTEDRGVRDMAFRVTRAQGEEIAQLRGYLTAWRTDAGPAGTAMTGMVGPDLYDAVRAARGPAFDRLWLQSMIAHHEGAVVMAEAELRDGVHVGARNTASNVVAVQRAEIATMRAQLTSAVRTGR